MSASEAIVVVEDWISEHYFTTDGKGVTFHKAVQELRKGWDQDAKDGHSTILKRFSAARGELQTAMASLGESDGFEAESNGASTAATTAASIAASLREVLGFTGDPSVLTFERQSSELEVTGLWIGDTREVLWVDGTPADGDDALAESRLVGVHRIDGKDRDTPLSKVLSELYLSEPSPKYIVICLGSMLYLTDRERWPEGRYLSADVQLVADRNETKKHGEVDRLLAIFGRQSLMPAADGALWWDERLDESRQHAVGVSQDLRDGIRESIEIVANDVLRRRTVQGLDNSEVNGQELAKQSLRFLYRILFLLYAEASPELKVLPKGTGEYDAGYGLDRLRELVQVELQSHSAQQGTHLYDSLQVLFELVNGDHPVHRSASSTGTSAEDNQAADEDETLERETGLTFEPLEADLFAPSATALINEVGLGNAELQRVLERLLLSRVKGKQERGFISYANLGINQLGAVYEGLMSYTGFIAEEDLLEVAKNGDATKGSWVVPVSSGESIDSKHFVRRPDEDTGYMEPVRYPRGSFVFRLAGRERQQSASYYTPEVLTKFVVSQALEELLDEDTPADRILELSVCEPALGSGAFALEAVRQLAEEYLERKQRELDERIEAEQYPEELQRVKAQIALHQVHGVDLNATAVELAEVSLWLDTMQPGLHAPWFGLHLKRGNSLVGARRATYSSYAVEKKKHLSEEPEAHPLTGLAEAMEHDGDDPAAAARIHHFLLPGEGWGAAADAKEVKDLAADEQKKLKDWAKGTKRALSKTQIKRLQAVSQRVERLWSFVLRRLQIAEQQARRHVPYWPNEHDKVISTVSRAEIEQSLADPNGAYRRLRRVMDAWTALWYWPLTEQDIAPPTVDEWIDGLEALLGKPGRASKTEGQGTLLSTADWADLNAAEELDLDFAGAVRHEAMTSRPEFAWLTVCDRVATEQGFFHWDLEFAPVFARGGFDLQVGNPPWVRPDWDEKAVFAEFDPWWQLEDKPSQASQAPRRQEALASVEHTAFMKTVARDIVGTRQFLSAPTVYPIVSGLRPDLYRSFMERTWASASATGAVSLIHPGTHFTEKRATDLRASTYRRLRRHWAFRNKKKMFADLTDQLEFAVNVYGPPSEEPSFVMAASIYVPATVEASFRHDGSGAPPGLKTDEGDWDVRGHAERLVRVDTKVLGVWADILDEPGTSPLHARMVYPVNRASMTVLEKLSKAPRVRELGLQYSSGWNETTDRKKGYFDVGSKVNDSWDDVIVQGPHFNVANPFAKVPRVDLRSNNDWDEIDLEALPADFIPRTSYQPTRDGSVDYDADYGDWVGPDGNTLPERSCYRLAWRRMAAISSVRTLIPTIIPPGAAHLFTLRSAYGSHITSRDIALLLGCFSSIPLDFFVKTSGVADLTESFVESVPRVMNSNVDNPIIKRGVELISLTEVFDDFAESAIEPEMSLTRRTTDISRRRALIELDVLVSIGFGISADQLCTIYRTQFPVLRGYEQNDLYDANGRKVPGEMNKLYGKVGEEGMTAEDLRWTHPQSQVEYTFKFPFRNFDREEDMRAAYAKFSRMLEEHGEIIEDED